MELDAGIIGYTVKYDALAQVQSAGVSEDDFVDEFRTIWRFILRTKRQHDSVPSPAVLKSRFPELSMPRVRERDFPIMLAQLRQRTKYKRFIMAMQAAAQNCTDFDAVEDTIQNLQGELNSLSMGGAKGEHLVDLFSTDIKRQMMREITRRRRGQIVGLPTGLERFDSMAGGLVKQKMVVIIGRTGLGKSWLDLLFVATSVIGGAKFILYPLEMTLFETAARLYTLFSQRMFGAERVMKNYDITTGKVTKAKVVRLLNALEDKFAGQLYVADMAKLSDPYTNERIDAEVEIHQPDGYWVDYITLMRAPNVTRNGDGDWAAVRQLSNGIKSTAMRRNVISGCSAQVNREALKVRTFLPRLEHISYGDSIGHDADQVFSINRNEKGLWYALVKNRGGPEIGKTRMTTDFNSGVLREHPEQEVDED